MKRHAKKIRSPRVVVGRQHIGRRQFMARLAAQLSPSAMENVETAYVFSKYGHRNQWRDGGRVRYFEHPKAVARIVIEELRITDWRTIVDALLHDTVEDSFLLTYRRIERNFGPVVACDVRLLTKKPKHGYLQRLRRYCSNRVLVVKLSDRLHNLRTLAGCSSRKQIRQIAETRAKYVPLSEILISRLSAKDRWRGKYLRDQIVAICEMYEGQFAK